MAALTPVSNHLLLLALLKSPPEGLLAKRWWSAAAGAVSFLNWRVRLHLKSGPRLSEDD